MIPPTSLSELAEYLKSIKEPILPANQPRRFDVELPFSPRMMFPVHMEGTNDNPEYDDRPEYEEWQGRNWSLNLIMVPMDSVRMMFTFNRTETPEARKNLQVWVNNLGEALYNPLWWRVGFPQLEYRTRRHGGRWPHRQNPLIDRRHGTHRIRTLEALDFDFVYVYFQTGQPYRFPRSEEWQMRRNERPPVTSTTTGTCKKCGGGIRWHGGRDLTKSTLYTCKNCGYDGERPAIYPEPV